MTTTTLFRLALLAVAVSVLPACEDARSEDAGFSDGTGVVVFTCSGVNLTVQDISISADTDVTIAMGDSCAQTIADLIEAGFILESASDSGFVFIR